ncbi:hypothetical protein V3C99_015928, partial [Haemonchus contortus]
FAMVAPTSNEDVPFLTQIHRLRFPVWLWIQL